MKFYYKDNSELVICTPYIQQYALVNMQLSNIFKWYKQMYREIIISINNIYVSFY